MTQAPSTPNTGASPDLAPQPPVEPGDFDCCNSECGDACVWEIYRLAKAKYQADLEAWQIRELLRD